MAATAQQLAEIFATTIDDVRERTTHNALALFQG
jgi:Tat protein secretion system quality control protein TatD with DNase activity